ncbi:hypothetical protein KC332_g5424 [Hortaea werneckii]|nr:hypothetical protein KC358_g5530 [Hortaea werneckii]KAI6845396.1 hypothetical protein KC350_g4478 [Hortaea werneckii]KAI6937274.1 hypothetical protein KC348_g5779 [Hortaea werneckii]KAI6937740.1 hypothetical protein KC341_g5372 [Hortaea werneckii]KAI6973328.1 hypothetical protein KC321_g5740 [Hortaea werneckii]
MKDDQQRRQSSEKKCIVLERNSQALQTELQQLQTENKELQRSNKKLSGELGELKTQQKELQSGQKQLQHKQKQSQTELHGLQAQHGLVSQQYEAALNERDDLRVQVSVLQSHADLHAGELEQHFMDCEDLFIVEYDGLQRQVYQLQSESWFTNKELSRLTTLLVQQEVQTQLDTRDKRISQLTDSHRSVSAKLKLPNKTHTQREAQISRLNVENRDLKITNAGLEKHEASLVFRIVDLEAESFKKKESLSSLQDSNEQLSGSNQRLSAEIQLANTVPEQQHDPTTAHECIEDISRYHVEEVSLLEKYLKTLSTSLSKTPESSIGAPEHSGFPKQDLHPLQRKIEAGLQAVNNLCSEYVSLQLKSDEQTTTIRSLEHDNKQGLDDMKKLRGKCQSLMQTISNARSSMKASKRPAQGDELPQASLVKRRKE